LSAVHNSGILIAVKKMNTKMGEFFFAGRGTWKIEDFSLIRQKVSSTPREDESVGI